MDRKPYRTILLSLALSLLVTSNTYAYNELDFGRLKRTGSCRKCNLEGAPLIGANLTGADLRGSSLRGANLQKATLYKAKLPPQRFYRYANFTGAMWVNGRICRQGSIGRCTCQAGDWSESGADKECVAETAP